MIYSEALERASLLFQSIPIEHFNNSYINIGYKSNMIFYLKNFPFFL